jgi:hypothetical protein
MRLFRRHTGKRRTSRGWADGGLDRATLDRILEGGTALPATAPPQARQLVRVLRAATAPAHPEELRGEHVARAGFRTARLHPEQGQRRAPASGTALTRLLSVKALAVLLGAAATAGGVALAANTGVLPEVLDPGETVTSTSAVPSNRTPKQPRGPSKQQGPNTGTNSVDATQETIERLCLTYLEKSRPEREKALSTPEFRPLVLKADGANKVDNFCDKLPKRQASKAPGPPDNAGPPSHPAAPNPGPPNPAAPDPGASGGPGQGQQGNDRPPVRRTASPDR